MEIWFKDFIYGYMGEKLKLTSQQRDIFNDIKNNRYTHFVKSRQIGYTTLIANHIACYLLTNYDKTVMYTMPKKMQTKYALKLIKNIIIHLQGEHFITRSSYDRLELKNGSKILFSGLSVDAMRSWDIDLIIMDEVFDINFLSAAIGAMGSKGRMIIGTSVYQLEHAKFVLKNMNDISLGWVMKLLHYSKCDLYNPSKINHFKSVMGETFEYEMELNVEKFIEKHEMVKPITNNKTKILQFRVEDNLEFKLLEKLSREDITLSTYLRNLIKKDLNI